MKKVITVCILLVAVCMLSAGLTYAAETASDGQTFYIANENITVYVYSSDNTPQQAFVIPESYYFRVLSSGASYTEIVYAKSDTYSGISLYVSNEDLQNKASVTQDSVTDSNAYYNLDFTPASAAKLYKPGELQNPPISLEFVSNAGFLGVYQANNEIYFAIVITSEKGNSVMLLSAKETDKATFTMSEIRLHQNTIDKNEAETDEIISTPGDGNVDVSGNNVIRNVMIAVICVLCVLVIFLIFRPTKNAKNRYEMDNRENASKRYDDDRFSD